LPSRALVIDDPKACDVNGDGEVNIADVNWVLDDMFEGQNRSDVDGDGVVNYIDLAAIYQVIYDGEPPKTSATLMATAW